MPGTRPSNRPTHRVDGSAELYDVVADPHELKNLAGDSQYRDAEYHLRGLLLDHWLSNLPYQSSARDQPPYRVRSVLDKEYRAFRAAGGQPEDAPAPSF
jgi:hypothetical protein